MLSAGRSERVDRRGVIGLLSLLLCLGCSQGGEDRATEPASASQAERGALGEASGRGAVDPVFSSPSDELRNILLELDRAKRMTRLAAFLSTLSADQFPALARFIERRPMIPAQEDIGLFVHVWTRADAEAAFETALDWRRREMGWTETIPNHVVSEAVYVRAMIDPDAAKAAISTLPPELSNTLRVAYVRGLAASGKLDRAFAEVAPGRGPMGQALLGLIAERIVEERGLEAGIEWAQSIEGDAKKRLFRIVGGVAARVDADRAREWVAASVAEPHAAGMLEYVADSLAKYEDPADVIAWVDGFEQERERKRASNAVFLAWHRRDSQAAANWARERVPLEDTFVPSLVTTAIARYQEMPWLATEWIEGIQDPEGRRATRVALALRWRRDDPESANQWIDEVGIREDVDQAAKRREARAAERKKAKAQRSQ